MLSQFHDEETEVLRWEEVDMHQQSLRVEGLEAEKVPQLLPTHIDGQSLNINHSIV